MCPFMVLGSQMHNSTSVSVANRNGGYGQHVSPRVRAPDRSFTVADEIVQASLRILPRIDQTIVLYVFKHWRILQFS